MYIYIYKVTAEEQLEIFNGIGGSTMQDADAAVASGSVTSSVDETLNSVRSSHDMSTLKQDQLRGLWLLEQVPSGISVPRNGKKGHLRV